MLIALIYNKGLPKEILQQIEAREFSIEALTKMHEELKGRYSNKKKGFSLAVILVLISAVLVMSLYLMQAAQALIPFFSILMGLAFVIVIAMVYVRKNIVDKAKTQFIQAVKKGYPEIAENFSESSFD